VPELKRLTRISPVWRIVAARLKFEQLGNPLTNPHTTRVMRGMEVDPLDLQDFSARFGSDDDCREYVRQLRWPESLAARGVVVRAVRQHEALCCVVMAAVVSFP
jgi:hypothetical protein